MPNRKALSIGLISIGLILILAIGLILILVASPAIARQPNAPADAKSKKRTLNVLFIGNSYTGRHKLAEVVTQMAEAGNPNLSFRATAVIYGGRKLVDHWRLGTQNFVNLHSLTPAQQERTIASLLATLAKNPGDRHAKSALARHRKLLANLNSQSTQTAKWDVVVLQSYRDDLDGDRSLYAQYAPKFAALAKAQGARVVLYETTPTTQNAKPLSSAPDPTPIKKKARAIADLANRIEASVAPMSLVALRCQTERPDLTLRFINDAHLNKTMAYLTACTLYAAIFDRSPQGLPIDSVTDIRFLNNTNRTKDRDGNPITKKFSAKDREHLQRIAWVSYLDLKKLRRETQQ